MLRSTFYQIYIDSTGEDITDLCESFDYEDSTEKDDLLSLSLVTKDIAVFDADWLVIGTKLRFIFGYINGVTSGVRLAKISDIDWSYGDTLKAGIKATDIGMFIKKNQSTRQWSGKTASDIALEIADTFNLTANVQPTSKKITMPQGGKSDFDFLKYLAKRENLHFYISGETLNFVKRDLAKPSLRTYTFGAGTDIISFKPSAKQSNSTPQALSQKVTSMDMAAGEAKETVATDKDKELVKQGLVKATNNNNKLGKFEFVEKSNVPIKQNGNADNSSNKSLAQNEVKESMQKGITATLEIEGDPNMKAGETITIAGVAKKHEGNYLVESVRHKLGQNAYICSLELSKNATNKPINNREQDDDNQEINKTVGDESKTDAKKLVKIRNEGNKLRVIG